MIRRPPRSTPLYSSAASDVYKRQLLLHPRVRHIHVVKQFGYNRRERNTFEELVRFIGVVLLGSVYNEAVVRPARWHINNRCLLRIDESGVEGEGLEVVERSDYGDSLARLLPAEHCQRSVLQSH
eukprot:TRINITY_DN1491_c0_g1_i6.p1 TRINITY_DN1491_c0_g1~~TRINITY_DN1491_c0_g1_i6.p1  ORF type:complete len:133 (+),score=13.84 TRINITY_DN1491_c0_g1_i6:25-399(+)